MNYRHYTIFAFILGISALSASFLFDVVLIQFLLGLIYIIVIIQCFGRLFFKKLRIAEQFIFGFLITIFAIIIIGTISFYAYALNDFSFFIITLALPVLLFFGFKYKNSSLSTPHFKIDSTILSFIKKAWKDKIFLILIITFLSLTVILFSILISNSTTQPIRTPWEILPSYFFVLFFINTLTLITILLKKNFTNIINYKLILISIYLFLFFSVAYFIYQLGYGFDPFIHRATLKMIWETGTISPKPLYYIGEYGLIFYLAKLLGLSINFLEKILAPLSAALFLPTVLYYYLTHNHLATSLQNRGSAKWLVMLSAFLIPLNFFIATTPQNLANLFFIILIILSLSFSSSLNKNKITILVLGAISIFFIHPLAGIPAILFLLLYIVWFLKLQNFEFFTGSPNDVARAIREGKLYFKLFLLLVLASLISLPIIWLIQSQISPSTTIVVNSEILSTATQYWQNLKLLNPINNGQFKIILNTIYFFYFNFALILIFIVGFASIKIYRAKWAKPPIGGLAPLTHYFPYLISFLIFFINYLILKTFLNFSFLINYERKNYTDRVFIISLFFLIPFILYFFTYLWQKIKLKNFWLKYSLIITLAVGLTAALYLTYPRHDDFAASHGYNTSQFDLEAVNYINKTASGDFIVLANQQISAASLREFGFKKYYQTELGQIFYYSIPTGGPLYQYYLELVNQKPTKEIMARAMNLVGVKESYLVVNKYWWNFQRIVDWAKLEADKYNVIGDEYVYIFKFIRQ